MPTTFASHVVIHDIMPTGTPTGPPPIHPGHRVQARSHIAGMLLKYVDADTGVILRDNGEIMAGLANTALSLADRTEDSPPTSARAHRPTA